MSYPGETPVGVQKLFLESIIDDPTFYTEVYAAYRPECFDKSLRAAAAFIKEYEEEYGSIPTIELVNAGPSQDLKEIPAGHQQNITWFKKEFGVFMRKAVLTKNILESADLLMTKNDVVGAVQLLQNADEISIVTDIGTDPMADPAALIQELVDSQGQIPTGWRDIDYKLFGGFNKGELNIFAGCSGAGKSTFLQNIGVNWQKAGLNGVYITLELGVPLASRRYYSIASSVAYSQIEKQKNDVVMNMNTMRLNKCGQTRIKNMPAQSTTQQIRAYIKELITREKMDLDYVLVDYLDLVMPVSQKVAVGDVFTKDKLVSEELRNLAQEFNVLMVTASQLNRSAVEIDHHDHSHIAGGISKVNTADNLFAIVPNRETGKFIVQFLKTRSSGGVGSRVILDYNTDNLQITNSDDKDYQAPMSKPRNTPLNIDKILGKKDSNEKLVLKEQQTKLQSMLDRLNK